MKPRFVEKKPSANKDVKNIKEGAKSPRDAKNIKEAKTAKDAKNPATPRAKQPTKRGAANTQTGKDKVA